MGKTSALAESHLGLSQGSQFLQSKAAKIRTNPYLINKDRSCCSGPGIVPAVYDLPQQEQQQQQQATSDKPTQEGFGGNDDMPAVDQKNLAEFNALKALQATYQQKLSAHAAAHKTLMATTSRYVTSSNDAQLKDFNMRVTKGPLLSDIPVVKQGCYLLGSGNELNVQNDLGESVSQGTCVMRAADLGFSVVGLQGGTGKCLVGKNLVAAQKIGKAYTPQTSYAFSASTASTAGIPMPADINKMQLFNNGQIGLFNSTTDYTERPEKLLLFKTPIEGCDLTQGGNIIMKNAIYGGNCDKQHQIIPRATLTSNIRSNFCVNQYGGSMDNNLRAEMRTCNVGDENQEFTYNAATKAIKYGHGGKCLDVAGAGRYNGAPIIQWNCHGGQNQQWTYGADKTLRPAHAPNMCLDVWGGSSADGAELKLYGCHVQPNQQFTFRSAPAS